MRMQLPMVGLGQKKGGDEKIFERKTAESQENVF